MYLCGKNLTQPALTKIAREAAVSKVVLYSHLDDKRLLCMEVTRLECAQLAEHAAREIDISQPPKIVLRFAGHKTWTSSARLWVWGCIDFA